MVIMTGNIPSSLRSKGRDYFQVMGLLPASCKDQERQIFHEYFLHSFQLLERGFDVYDASIGRVVHTRAFITTMCGDSVGQCNMSMCLMHSLYFHYDG